MDEFRLVALSYQLIQKDFQLDTEKDEEVITSFEALKLHLVRIVKYLLDHDMNRLLTILYRIDVGEERVKQLLATSAPDLLAENLADAIIAREKVKVAFRLKYSS